MKIRNVEIYPVERFQSMIVRNVDIYLGEKYMQVGNVKVFYGKKKESMRVRNASIYIEKIYESTKREILLPWGRVQKYECMIV